MKIENSNVMMKSNHESKTAHSSSLVKFEIHHSLNQVQNNETKAKVATELLLHTDFRSPKEPTPQDKLNGKVIGKTIENYFQTNTTLEHSAIVIEKKEHYHHKQTIDFQSYLEIQTKEQKLNIDLELSFSKELYEAHSMELVLGNAKILDPLVINYDDDINPFENLSKLKFEFDLDSDGETEAIPFLKKGAGFLALDSNNNGKIDNGSELFGPKTNDGFKELSHHDSDHNNWIDENDPVFNKLKIWQINENGDNQLVSLVDLNVGAIYLNSVQSGYTYQDSIDKIDAIQKSNGVYVKNDGSGAHMINALDIALQQKV
jgi:hypothetical protein